MVITEPGKVTEGITQLGRFESCVQLLHSKDEAFLIGGGMSYVVPDLLEQIERFEIDERQITRLIVLHAHFDHCGLIPYLKKRWPWAKVTASARAQKLLATPKVSQTIAFLNQAAASRYDREQVVKEKGYEFTGIEVDDVVEDGQTLACGDLRVRVLAVPGHSSCSIALYEPEEKALFASDAAGVSHEGYFFSAGNSNFDQYEESLKKMATLEINVLTREHFGVLTGEDAKTQLPNAIEEAAKMRELLERTCAQEKNLSKATEQVVEALRETAPESFMPKEIITMVVRQMVKHIAKARGQG